MIIAAAVTLKCMLGSPVVEKNIQHSLESGTYAAKMRKKKELN